MSFILEALRKSDARRRNDQGPTLVSEPILTRPVRRWRWSGVTAAGLILLSSALVMLSLQTELVNRLMPRETALSSPTLDDLPVPQLPGEPASVALAAPTESKTPTAEPAREPDTPNVDQAKTQASTEHEPAPAAEPATPTPTPTMTAAIATEYAGAESTNTESADYLMLWELPLAVRQDLPALTMNLHLFTADEASRFVLINGQRRRQGERLPGGIEVVEIRPEGAILESRGYRFLLRR